MKTFTAAHDMRFRPSSAEFIEGGTYKLQFKLANAIGSDTISGTPTITSSELTFTSTTLTGTTLTTKVSGGSANRNYIAYITMVSTTSAETTIGSVELEWKQPGYEFRAGVR